MIRLIDLLAVAVEDMRQGGDPRLPLELALVKVTRPGADLSRESLAYRLEQLERGGVRAAPAEEHHPATGGAAGPAPARGSARERHGAASRRARAAPGGVAADDPARGRGRSIPTAAMLREARPAALADDTLTVEFPAAASFQRGQAEEPTNATLLQEALYEVTGRRLGGRVRARRARARRRRGGPAAAHRGRVLRAGQGDVRRPRGRGGPMKGMDMNKLMQQAAEMQANLQKAQEELANEIVEARPAADRDRKANGAGGCSRSRSHRRRSTRTIPRCSRTRRRGREQRARRGDGARRVAAGRVDARRSRRPRPARVRRVTDVEARTRTRPCRSSRLRSDDAAHRRGGVRLRRPRGAAADRGEHARIGHVRHRGGLRRGALERARRARAGEHRRTRARPPRRAERACAPRRRAVPSRSPATSSDVLDDDTARAWRSSRRAPARGGAVGRRAGRTCRAPRSRRLLDVDLTARNAVASFVLRRGAARSPRLRRDHLHGSARLSVSTQPEARSRQPGRGSPTITAISPSPRVSRRSRASRLRTRALLVVSSTTRPGAEGCGRMPPCSPLRSRISSRS